MCRSSWASLSVYSRSSGSCAIALKRSGSANLTYLFVVIGIALLNALANGSITLAELLIANTVIVGTVGLLEAAPFSSREASRTVRYDRLELLNPDAATDLLADLRKRTHLPVERFEIGDVDLLRDTADVTIHYRSE